MKQRIIFRADGNSEIGLGHIMRLLGLAEMLKDHFMVSFATQNANSTIAEMIQPYCNEIISLPASNNFLEEARFFSENYITTKDIVVTDGYQFKSDYQKTLKNSCKKLVCIDDLHSWHQYADVVINHAMSVSDNDYSKEPYTQTLLGLKYALLRPIFFETSAQHYQDSKLKNIFVSMGGADAYNTTGKVIKALSTLNEIEKVYILIGKVNQHNYDLPEDSKFEIKNNLNSSEICHLLRKCQLAICPASTTAIEACAIGIGILSGYTAENQLDILKGLEKNDCVINMGNLLDVSEKEINEKIYELIHHTQRLNSMRIAQSKIIDGKTPTRMLELFKQLSHA